MDFRFWFFYLLWTISSLSQVSHFAFPFPLHKICIPILMKIKKNILTFVGINKITNFFLSSILLTHFSQMSHFYTPWKRQKTKSFLTFSGDIKMWHWTKMGQGYRGVHLVMACFQITFIILCKNYYQLFYFSVAIILNSHDTLMVSTILWDKIY